MRGVQSWAECGWIFVCVRCVRRAKINFCRFLECVSVSY